MSRRDPRPRDATADTDGPEPSQDGASGDRPRRSDLTPPKRMNEAERLRRDLLWAELEAQAQAQTEARQREREAQKAARRAAGRAHSAARRPDAAVTRDQRLLERPIERDRGREAAPTTPRPPADRGPGALAPGRQEAGRQEAGPHEARPQEAGPREPGPRAAAPLSGFRLAEPSTAPRPERVARAAPPRPPSQEPSPGARRRSAPPPLPGRAALRKVVAAAPGAVRAAVALPPTAGGRPSAALTILAGVMAAYLTVALAYAADHALLSADAAAGAVAIVGLVLVALAGRVRAHVGVAIVLGLSFLLQVNWAAWADPQPIADLGQLWIGARRFGASLAAGEIDWRLIEESASPTTLLVYALAMLGLGDDLSLLRVFSAGLWTAQAWLVWRIALRTPELKDNAVAAAALFALYPTVLVYGALPSVEAVFGVFALGAVYMLASYDSRGLPLSAGLAGVLAALAFLTAPIGGGLALGFAAALVIAIIAGRRWTERRVSVLAAGALVAGFLVGLAPQAAMHASRSNEISVAQGAHVGYQLLIGSNFASGGRFSEASSTPDLRAAGLMGENRLPVLEANRQAIAIAAERIAEQPLRFVVFAATDKMRRLWESEREMLTYSLNGAAAAARPNDLESRIWPIGAPTPSPESPAEALVDGAYLAFLAAAALAAWRLTLSRGKATADPFRWALVYGALCAMALFAAFLEARPRQHLALTPLLALTLPLALAGRRRIARADIAAAAARLWGGVSSGLDWAAARLSPPRRDPALAAEAEPNGGARPILRPETAAFDAAASARAESQTAEPTAQDRLATVLSKMSKPPRPDEEAAASSEAAAPLAPEAAATARRLIGDGAARRRRGA